MNASAPGGWRPSAIWLSVLIGGGGYLALSLWGGWRETLEAVSRIGLAGVAGLLSLSLVNYGLRFVRWQGYLDRLGHALPWRESLRFYVSGFALTTTPGKAGEAVRALYLRPHGVPYGQTVGLLFAERLSDLLAVLLLASAGFSVWPAARPWVSAGLIGGGLAAWLLGNRPWRARLESWGHAHRGRLARATSALAQGAASAGRCLAPGPLLSGLLLAGAAWGAEGVAFAWLLHMLDVPLSLSAAVAIYALAMLAGAASFMPGGLGGAEAAMILLLVLNGVTEPIAVSATVIIRLATLWFAVALGLIALPRGRG